MSVATATAPYTLADLDDEADFGPLEDALFAVRPGHCDEVEFYDDNHDRGYRALEFDVHYVARHEWDEDGCSPVLEKARVNVKVLASMPIEQIVDALIREINDLITD